jgi:hypothetical protein
MLEMFRTKPARRKATVRSRTYLIVVGDDLGRIANPP